MNLPGTPTSVRPNWQRPMRHLLEEIADHPGVADLVRRLAAARHHPAPADSLAHS